MYEISLLTNQINNIIPQLHNIIPHNQLHNIIPQLYLNKVKKNSHKRENRRRRNCQTIFQSSCTVLPSQEQCMRVPVFLVCLCRFVFPSGIIFLLPAGLLLTLFVMKFWSAGDVFFQCLNV